jgi:hypothetical protein
LRDGDRFALSNETQKETHMLNQKLKRTGQRLQFVGLFILLADAIFAFCLFRGDLGDRYLKSVYFRVLITAVIAFAACLIWGGSRLKIRRNSCLPLFPLCALRLCGKNSYYNNEVQPI